MTNTFYIRPLVPLVAGGERFYILALNQDNVRLYQGSRYRIGEVAIDSMPTSLAEALRFDDPERQVQFHTSTGSAQGNRDAIYHGHGTAGDDATRKENILRFFRELDNGIVDLLNDEQVPLIMAGVDSLCGLYRQANQYDGLMSEFIATDPQTLDETELHQQAWAILDPNFQAQHREARDAYEQLAGSDDDRAVHTLQQIVPAAYFQRIDTLFINETTQHWGTFDEQNSELTQRESWQAGDYELMNEATRHTLINGGKVIVTDDLPTNTAQAAILRY